jgi:hypothetical protein
MWKKDTKTDETPSEDCKCSLMMQQMKELREKARERGTEAARHAPKRENGPEQNLQTIPHQNNQDRNHSSPTKKEGPNKNESMAALIPPALCVVGAVGALNVGVSMRKAPKVSPHFYLRQGMGGGVFGLGAYLGMRTVYQTDHVSRMACLTAGGSCVGLGVGICDSLKPAAALKRGLGGGLVCAGAYGAVWTLLLCNECGVHRRG